MQGEKTRMSAYASPVEILREQFSRIDEVVLNLPPIRLESLLPLFFNEKPKSGCYEPILVPTQFSNRAVPKFLENKHLSESLICR
jgi:hypothetical protein